MEHFRMEIYSNEDIDLIEDMEEREEAQEAYEDEIEAIYQYLVSEQVVFDQVNDNIFSITIDTFKDRYNQEEINKLEKNIEVIIKQSDIVGISIENYTNA